MPNGRALVALQADACWCGIDEPQRLPHLHSYLLSHEGQYHYGGCSGAFTHVFDKYKDRAAKVVRFQIHQGKFLKEMFVGREKWIGSADIGFGHHFRASENGHDVSGDFLSDFVAVGTISLHGQHGYFYAIWVSD